MYYAANQNELYHYGIKGQKWGIRRYQNPDGTLTAEGRKRYDVGSDGRKAKYNIADRARAEWRYTKASVKGQFKGAGNAIKRGKIGEAGSYLFGHKGLAVAARANRDFRNELANHSKTKFGKALSTSRSKNADELAKYHEKVSRDTLGERFVRTMIFDTDAFMTPYHRMSGRTTTRGREAVNYMFTFGVAGLIGDATYLHKQKKASSNN